MVCVREADFYDCVSEKFVREKQPRAIFSFDAHVCQIIVLLFIIAQDLAITLIRREMKFVLMNLYKSICRHLRAFSNLFCIVVFG